MKVVSAPMLKKRINFLSSLRALTMIGRIVSFVFVGITLSAPQRVTANTPSSEECYRAARVASHESGVPLNVLLAIARVETGRKSQGETHPWPWAINHAGRGDWLQSKSDLLEKALNLIARGETSFDVGCFQLNYRWHGREFASLDEMISPKENARYAARFLNALFKEFGDWTEAAGAYHSRTDVLAKSYKVKFLVHYDEEAEPVEVALGSTSKRNPKRQNSYPLLVSRQTQARLGSLMPESSE